ncbi:hemerythrin domain-containing protein [Caldimonas tepidiphila]|uniref:hemerythrin domain-containing protein n=1 Tax=Caldimonas tepidiphila TaxID=2315841 RepID=UPI000E5A3973|nr:hemerythrin domain-containing protein [Caldimonas tepidiphila]
MTALTWTDTLVLDNPRMDTTHREFVELLNAVAAADDEALLPGFRELLEHTVEHFAQEERWMLATGFAPENCHQTQHAMVLQVMREVEQRAAGGETEFIRRLVPELASWFPQHAEMMDAALAYHCAQLGYDTTEEALRPGAAAPALPQAPITGCGSASCA